VQAREQAGKQTLSAVLVSRNLLAFAMHNACDLIESLWTQARATTGARQRLFEHLRSITAYLVFAGWTELVTTLPPPQPETSQPHNPPQIPKPIINQTHPENCG
jgi:hypothetical protein